MIRKLLFLFFCLFVFGLIVVGWGLEERPNPENEIKKSLERQGSYSFTDPDLERVCYVPYYGRITPIEPFMDKFNFFLVKLMLGRISDTVGDTSWWMVKLEKNNKVKIIEVKNNIYPKITHTICTTEKKILRLDEVLDQKQNKMYFMIENHGFPNSTQQPPH